MNPPLREIYLNPVDIIYSVSGIVAFYYTKYGIYIYIWS